MDELLKRLEALEGGADIAEEVRKEITKRNEEAKKHRQSKTELKDIVSQIMTQYDVKEPKEVIEKVTDSSNEVKMLMKKVDELTSTVTTEQEAKKKAELSRKITGVLAEKKITKNLDYHTNALMGMVKEGESGLLVGESALDDYVQKMIDEDSKIVGSIKKKEKQKSTSDVYSSDELDALSEEEIEKNMDKVDRSLQALG